MSHGRTPRSMLIVFRSRWMRRWSELHCGAGAARLDVRCDDRSSRQHSVRRTCPVWTRSLPRTLQSQRSISYALSTGRQPTGTCGMRRRRRRCFIRRPLLRNVILIRPSAMATAAATDRQSVVDRRRLRSSRVESKPRLTQVLERSDNSCQSAELSTDARTD